jgi:DNA repair photolyase
MKDCIIITTGSGEKIEAHAPVIISASRSTDIPAFYAEWFIRRLGKEFVVRYNPFNRQPMYISFKNTKVIIFWSKNPKPLIPYLKELDERDIHYYFQFTLNDYDTEGFEPNVPPLNARIETFRMLSDMIGKEKVIWRFDPLILTPALRSCDLLKKIQAVGNRIKGFTDKLVFSFIDIKAYRKVQNNLIKETSVFSEKNIGKAEFTDTQITEIAEGLAKIREQWRFEGWNLSLATCAEQVDLKSYGIEHNRCIDGELMKRLFPQDKALMHYLSYGKLPETHDLFGAEFNEQPVHPCKLKDKGQRKACGCMTSKDIGMYDTCSHFCVYCYANTSRTMVEKNKASHHINNESI